MGTQRGGTSGGPHCREFILDNAARWGLTSDSETTCHERPDPPRGESIDDWASDSVLRPRRPPRWLAGALVFWAACGSKWGTNEL